MSRRGSKVDDRYIDTQYSSGDSKKMKSKQLYKEENNNEIDELSKDLSAMGCIVDAVKRPPNICVETFVHEDNSGSEEEADANGGYHEEDAYSDEFEDDKSEAEGSVKTDKTPKSDISPRRDRVPNIVKMSKSHSSMSNHKAPSVSGTSTGYGSLSVPHTRRVNMSFSNDRLREIERHNHILLSKIMSARNKRKSSIPTSGQPNLVKPVPAAAAVQRKQQQRRIDHENMILLKKIQRAKSSSCSMRR